MDSKPLLKENSTLIDEQERLTIKQRQAEGIAAAKARGVKFGREPIKRPSEFDMVNDLWKGGNISAREAAKRLGVTHKTFLKWVSAEKIG